MHFKFTFSSHRFQFFCNIFCAIVLATDAANPQGHEWYILLMSLLIAMLSLDLYQKRDK